MSRLHKLVAGSVLAAVILGLVVLLVPVSAVAAPPGSDDPNCTHACPPTKKLHGYPCTFVGCDLEGHCGYAC
jgi:hypothetical protein